MAKRQRNKPKIDLDHALSGCVPLRQHRRQIASSSASKKQVQKSKAMVEIENAQPRIARTSTRSTPSKPLMDRESETAQSRIARTSTRGSSSKPLMERDAENAQSRIARTSHRSTPSKPLMDRDSGTAQSRIARTSTRGSSSKPLMDRDSETAQSRIARTSPRSTPSKPVMDRKTVRPRIPRSTPLSPSVKLVVDRDSETARSRTARTSPLSTSSKPVVDRHLETSRPRIKRSSPRSTSSTPSSLYDFMGESPAMDSVGNTGGKMIPVKKVTKTTNKQSKSVAENIKGKSKVSSKRTTEAQGTPEDVVSKAAVALERVNDRKECKEGGKRYRTLRPNPPPNLDDISPIPRDCNSTTLSRKRAAVSKQKTNDKCVKKVRLRSSKENENLIQITPIVSIMETTADIEANDSAIFVSPRQTLLRFSTGKTSTPADIPHKGKKIPTKKNVRKTVTCTSTPIESQPKRGYTRIKQHISKLSPVNRLGTPTSDYGSMESCATPSPTPLTKTNMAEQGNSPAFTLDDDSGEALNLNKSVDKLYKRSRKKYDSARFSTSKLEEWADKVNSELEDIENFELSVEG